MQTSLSNFHQSVAVIFCDNRLLNNSWLSETFFLLFEFVFRARTVLNIKCSVDNGCLQRPFLMSFQWTKVLPEWLSSLQWPFHCFATGRGTVDHLYNKQYFSEGTWNKFLKWVGNRMTFYEKLPSSYRETNFGLQSMCCSGSIEKAVPYFSYVWMFEFEHFDVNCMKSQFFSESSLVQEDA